MIDYQPLFAALKQHYPTQCFTKTVTIQSLWSGYGEIARLQSSDQSLSVIAKIIQPPAVSSHPRGWHSTTSHRRKLSSYINEQNFYQYYAPALNGFSRVAELVASAQCGETSWLLLEDLDAAGYAYRVEQANIDAVGAMLTWLAHFHATFMQQPCEHVWQRGSYWHLATRQDEWQAMPEGRLKVAATQIDERLANCPYKTLLHGDAKVANFCFRADLQKCAAVDFQYVGLGLGIQDVVYMLGSVFNGAELEQYYAKAIECYFRSLRQGLSNAKLNCDHLEKVWRDLLPFAWADFERFLSGWSPGHRKLNHFSAQQTAIALAQLGSTGNT